MDEKLQKIKELQAQKSNITAEIKRLTDEVTAELKISLHGQRKPRKPKQAK